MQNNTKTKILIPEWLRNYRRRQKLNFNKILNSGILYYPGGYVDMHPIKIFNKHKNLLTYVYVDYGHHKEDIIQLMKEEVQRQFMNQYDIYDVREFEISDIPLKDPVVHYSPSEEELKNIEEFSVPEEYGVLFVFKRKYIEEELPESFAIIYICCDGIRFYEKLFKRNYKYLKLCL